MEMGLIALGQVWRSGLAALATGLAQARIGAAVVGAAPRKTESLGTMIILLVIPRRSSSSGSPSPSSSSRR